MQDDLLVLREPVQPFMVRCVFLYVLLVVGVKSLRNNDPNDSSPVDEIQTQSSGAEVCFHGSCH